MTELPEEVEQDITHFMKKLENMADKDIKETLRLMFAKHLQISNSDFLLTGNNLHNIISNAKDFFVKLPTVVYLDGLEDKNRLDQGIFKHDDQLRIISIAEAVIGELRRTKILGRPVKFNYKKR